MYDVAITGIGIVSTLGTGIDKVKTSLEQGTSGIGIDPERKELGFRSALTGIIDDFEPPQMPRKQRKTLSDFGLQCYAAALEATKMAGWGQEDIQTTRTGLIIGNDSSSIANIQPYEVVMREKSTFPIGATVIFQALTSTVTMNLNTLFGNRGASWTISGACASGGHAVGQAAGLIAMGSQDRIICGGVQEITWQSVCSFDATNAFSIRMDDPSQACRPFDKDRDGLIPSGGAAVVALERGDIARKRGANILGWIRGYGFSSDGQNLSVPSGDGLRDCIELCLENANLNPEQIDYINAHATSTPVGDAMEARAIGEVFMGCDPWVSSTKSMTGHEMWMSGAAQVVYTLLMAQGSFIAPNLNFRTPDPEMPKLRIARETIAHKPKRALLNSAGFGGTNSCLIIESV